MLPELTKEQLYIVLGVIFVLLIGCMYSLFGGKEIITKSSPRKNASHFSGQAPQTPSVINTEVKPKTSIFVQISGAVERGGLYKLEAGDRMIDLLKLSRPSRDADIDSINLAGTLSDGQKVVVPDKPSMIRSEMPSDPAVKSPGKGPKVNINSADEKELDNLPGIGPVMAKKIISHREDKGRFGAIEDIKNIPGISEKKFEQMKEYISVY